MIYWRRLTDRLVKFWFPVLVLFVLFVSVSFSKDMAILQSEGHTIVLTDEPCQLPAVGNLPYRLTWTEKGKKFEGCWGIHSGIVVIYTDDRSVGLVPGQMFKPLTSS